MSTPNNYKELFIKAYKENIKRDGAEELLQWLENSDFFTAPASTKFHSACEGGLVQHSWSVYEVLCSRFPEEAEKNPESFAICALLHDICKVKFYKVSFRNVKDEATGRWEKVPFYAIEDSYPFGHGEKSVFLIERFMKLKPTEAIAIRWHMGGFDDSVKGGSYSLSQTFDRYPLAVMLHMADLESTYLCEKEPQEPRRQK